MDSSRYLQATGNDQFVFYDLPEDEMSEYLAANESGIMQDFDHQNYSSNPLDLVKHYQDQMENLKEPMNNNSIGDINYAPRKR